MVIIPKEIADQAAKPEDGMMRTMVNGSHQWWTTQIQGNMEAKDG
jgi:hypothetical protein